jgi:hypothetical protein
MGVLKDRILPADVPHDWRSLMGTFGSCEREISASFVIRLMVAKGGWVPFRKEELDAMEKSGRFAWNGLDVPKWIKANEDGTFEVTDGFIAKAMSSPVMEDQ